MYEHRPETRAIVLIIGSTAARTVIPKMDDIFARHGISDTTKSDNGATFNNEDFEHFARQLDFRHRKFTPFGLMLMEKPNTSWDH